MTRDTNKGNNVSESSGNIFADLGLPDPEERLAKAELARAVRHLVQSRGLSQAKAAKKLDIAASDMSDLMLGKLARFSQERIESFLTKLDMDVVILVRPKQHAAERGRVHVEIQGAKTPNSVAAPPTKRRTAVASTRGKRVAR